MAECCELKTEIFYLLERYNADLSKIKNVLLNLDTTYIDKGDANKFVFAMNRLAEHYVMLSTVLCGKFGGVLNFSLVKGYDIIKGCWCEEHFMLYRGYIEQINYLYSLDTIDYSKVRETLMLSFSTLVVIRHELYIYREEMLSFLDTPDLKYLSNLYGSVKSLYDRLKALEKDKDELNRIERRYKEILDNISDVVNSLCE